MTARLVGLASAAGALLAPAAALACPYCAANSRGGPVQGVVLAAFIFLPFAVAGAIIRFIRSEPPGGSD